MMLKLRQGPLRTARGHQATGLCLASSKKLKASARVPNMAALAKKYLPRGQRMEVRVARATSAEKEILVPSPSSWSIF